MSAKFALPAVAAAVFALAQPALAQKMVTQGVSDTEIKLGVHLDLSGPITMWGVPQRNGHIMRVEEQNAKGGVNGRKINLIIEDNGYDPKKGILATQKLINQDKVFALIGVLGTAIFIPSQEVALEQGIPFIFPGTNHRASFEPHHPLKFSMAAPYDSQVKNGVEYFAKTMNKKKFAVIYQDDDFGKDIKDAMEAQAKEMKLDVVARESYKRGETSFSSQVANAQRAGADVVFLGTVPRETAGVMAEMAKNGWKVDTMAVAAACIGQTVTLGKEAVENLYVQCQYPPLDPDTDTAAVNDWSKRYEARFNTKADIGAAVTYAMEDMVILALERAGRNLTVESFIKGLESIKNYQDIFGTPQQTFSATKHGGTNGFVLTRIQNGKFKRVQQFNG